MGDRSISSSATNNDFQQNLSYLPPPENNSQIDSKETTKEKKPRNTPIRIIVSNAIRKLAERGGSSFRAIKKFIAFNYHVDVRKKSPYIKRYINTAIKEGDIIRTKGKGMNGKFKLRQKVKVQTRRTGVELLQNSEDSNTTNKIIMLRLPRLREHSDRVIYDERESRSFLDRTVKSSYQRQYRRTQNVQLPFLIRNRPILRAILAPRGCYGRNYRY